MKTNKPPEQPAYLTGMERIYIEQVLKSGVFIGNGSFGEKCRALLESLTGSKLVVLTPSGTAALEMAALLSGVGPGDEVILPSFTFSSTATAFALRGARLVFVDIDPCTLNMDPQAFKAAITPTTKVVVPVHYAGTACAMDEITAITAEYGLLMVEDAAQAIMSRYKERPLGAIAPLGCLSFHESKNIQCGEGGALLVNEARFIERAKILQEKGTNRTAFFQGMVDKYTWVDLGSSYLLNELSAAFLLSQLENAAIITNERLRICAAYHHQLQDLEQAGHITLPGAPTHCQGNGHIFYILTSSLQDRLDLMAFLKKRDIAAFFHYVPLHSSPAGLRFGRAVGSMRHTEAVFARLLRLPVRVSMGEEEVAAVCAAIHDFYASRS